MARYRKKPVEIVAHRIGDDGWPDEIWEGVNRNEILLHSDPSQDGLSHVTIKSLEGEMRADVGDYIIRGANGDFYSCKAGIFEKTIAVTYELVE